VCSKCGAVLYESDELKSPIEIIQGLGGGCPSCGRKLDYTPRQFDPEKVRLVTKPYR
jgi:DNA-directed RNA polymerase subunit RPC12/RpoP